MSVTEKQRPFSAASFEQYLAEGKLMASQCNQCKAIHLPPHAVCPKCHSDDLSWIDTGGKGKLAAFTVVYIAPTFMVEQGYGRDNPYASGIVELDEGVKISARITGVDATQPEAIQVGAPVSVDFIHVGEGDQKKTYLAFKVGQ